MDRLAELRERRALTLRELAGISGVAADTINQIELGHRKARPSTLRKLAKALGVEVRELFEEPVPLDEAPREAGQPDGRQETTKAQRSPSAEAPEARADEGAAAAPSLGPAFYDQEGRLLRYLRVPQLHATKQSKLWAARVERGVFGEEEFRKGVDDFLDFEGAFVQGVGTDLSAALLNRELALPEAERKALDAAKAAIDAWYRMLREASAILKAAAVAQDAEAQDDSKVIQLAPYLERLEGRGHGEVTRSSGEADDAANVS